MASRGSGAWQYVLPRAADSVKAPGEVRTDHPVLGPNQGSVTAEPAGSGDHVPVMTLDLGVMLARLEQLGVERVDLCVSTPHLVSSVVRSDVADLAERCADVAVTDPVSRLEIDLMPDAGPFVRLAGPMVVAVGIWLGALLSWMRETRADPGRRAVWPVVASIWVAVVASFPVYPLAQRGGFGAFWGLAPWQTSAISLALYLLVLAPGLVALWPLWERAEQHRLDAHRPSGWPPGWRP